MKERPIIFTTESVRTILDGRKTQTRRVIKPAMWPLVEEIFRTNGYWSFDVLDGQIVSPYGYPGDRLWVKETFAKSPRGFVYHADWKDSHGQEVVDLETGETIPLVWKSSRFMPRKASRITLEVVRTRVQKLREINDDDAIREGISALLGPPIYEQYFACERRTAFKEIWNMINAKRGYSWENNPWVWVVYFEKLVATQ
jgi:hypothetical protein